MIEKFVFPLFPCFGGHHWNRSHFFLDKNIILMCSPQARTVNRQFFKLICFPPNFKMYTQLLSLVVLFTRRDCCTFQILISSSLYYIHFFFFCHVDVCQDGTNKVSICVVVPPCENARYHNMLMTN
jgi:hypothetical protein